MGMLGAGEIRNSVLNMLPLRFPLDIKRKCSVVLRNVGVPMWCGGK